MKNMISSNIRYLRAKENMTQEEFAECFGVSRRSVAKWERGQIVIPKHARKVFDIQPGDRLRGELASETNGQSSKA